jgi:hypothetical protein
MSALISLWELWAKVSEGVKSGRAAYRGVFEPSHSPPKERGAVFNDNFVKLFQPQLKKLYRPGTSRWRWPPCSARMLLAVSREAILPTCWSGPLGPKGPTPLHFKNSPVFLTANHPGHALHWLAGANDVHLAPLGFPPNRRRAPWT